MSGETGRLALGIVGGVIGAYVGGPTGAALGYSLAYGVSGMVFPTRLPGVQQEGPRLDDLKIQSSTYGTSVPVCFGTVRCAGQVIWAQPIKQTTHTTTEEVGGKGAPPSQEITTTTYSYSISCAISICEGPIIGIRKIWANGELVHNASTSASYSTNFASQQFSGGARIYLGDQTQNADPLILATEGHAPAYRGLAYIVFDTLQLEKWYNHLPNFEFEVIATAGTRTDPTFQLLHAANQLPAATAMSGGLGPNGLMLAAIAEGISFNRLVLMDPTNGRILREYPYQDAIGSTDYNDTCPQSDRTPAINAYGDICWGATSKTWVWRVGDAPTNARTNGGGLWMLPDAEGNFIISTMLYAPIGRNAIIKWSRDSGDSLFYALPPVTASYAGFDSRDGAIWISQSSSPTNAAILKFDKNGGLIQRLDLTDYASSIAIAGDGSLWWFEQASGRVMRAPASNLNAGVLITTSPSVSNLKYTRAKLARDWETGEILFNAGPGAAADLYRYSADGTQVTMRYTNAVPNLIAPYGSPDAPALMLAFCPLNALSDSLHRQVGAERASTYTPASDALSNVVTKLCARVGLTAAQLDLTNLVGSVVGYKVTQRAPARGALEPLMTAYSFDCVESGNKLKFITRGSSSVLSIPEDDMGARGADDAPGEAVVTQRTQEPELPREVAIKFLDAAVSYQVSAQYQRRLVKQSENDAAFDLAVVLTPVEANELAAAMLYEAWMARMRYSFAVGQRYTRLEPCDVCTLALDSGPILGRIITKSESAGILKFDALGYAPEVYAQTLAAASAPAPDENVGIAGPTNSMLLDIPLLRDGDDEPGFYAEAGGYAPGWPGARLFKSAGDGSSVYSDTGIGFIAEASLGYSASRLAAFYGGDTFDELNSVDVSLTSGALFSTTAAAVRAGANHAVLGSELIGFKSATLLTSGYWRLSGLLRGRAGTEWAMLTHVIGERFALLDTSTTVSVNAPVAEVGLKRQYKSATLGSALDTTPAQDLTLAANRIKPLSPVFLAGGRIPAGDVIWKWIRRARVATAWRDLLDVALDEPTEAYELDLYAGAGFTISGVTKEYAAVFTTTGAHGFIVGDNVHLTGIAGDIGALCNNAVFLVATVPTTTKFTITSLFSGQPVSTGALNAWTSGGTVRKRARTITATTQTATYTSAQQTTDYGSNQATVYAAVYQMSSRVGRGFPGVSAGGF